MSVCDPDSGRRPKAGSTLAVPSRRLSARLGGINDPGLEGLNGLISCRTQLKRQLTGPLVRSNQGPRAIHDPERARRLARCSCFPLPRGIAAEHRGVHGRPVRIRLCSARAACLVGPTRKDLHGSGWLFCSSHVGMCMGLVLVDATIDAPRERAKRVQPVTTLRKRRLHNARVGTAAGVGRGSPAPDPKRHRRPGGNPSVRGAREMGRVSHLA